MKRRDVLAGAIASAAFADRAWAAKAGSGAPIRVVASFSILGDIVRTIAGPRVTVQDLVGPDSDAHVFEPSAADVRAVAGADLVVVNGLGFEGWMTRLFRAVGRRQPPVVATAGVHPLMAGGVPDPHAWQNPLNGVIYVRNIAAALGARDPASRTLFLANAARYRNDLLALDRWTRQTIAATPSDRRTILTVHDAFQYFGQAYGVNFVAPIGLSTQAEPSAREVASLIDQIRRDQIAAVMIENITDPRIIDQIARDTNVRVWGKLYSDALSKSGGEADTYLKLLNHNASTIASALTHPLAPEKSRHLI